MITYDYKGRRVQQIILLITERRGGPQDIEKQILVKKYEYFT